MYIHTPYITSHWVGRRKFLAAQTQLSRAFLLLCCAVAEPPSKISVLAWPASSAGQPSLPLPVAAGAGAATGHWRCRCHWLPPPLPVTLHEILNRDRFFSPFQIRRVSTISVSHSWVARELTATDGYGYGNETFRRAVLADPGRPAQNLRLKKVRLPLRSTV